jgi:hypothetical protein
MKIYTTKHADGEAGPFILAASPIDATRLLKGVDDLVLGKNVNAVFIPPPPPRQFEPQFGNPGE